MSKNITELHEFDFYNQQIRGIDITMQKSNYSVCLGLTGFWLKNPAEKFTIDLLQELFSKYTDSPAVNGIITRISFDSIKETIDSCLGYKRNFTYGDKFYAAQSHIYWAIIKKALDQKIPPTICYNHSPAGQSFFTGLMWDFCFILINGNKGIVISGCALD